MNTSGYFIELLIAGFSTIIWWILFSFCIWDFWIPIEMLKFLLSSTTLVILLFPAIYIAGIVSDRMADLFFIKYTRIGKIEDLYFDSHNEYEKCRSIIYLKSQSLRELYEYGRTRIRICRNWVFNSPLIWFFGVIFTLRDNFFHINFTDKILIIFFISLLFLGSTIMTYKSLLILVKKECHFIKIQAELINSNSV